MPQTTDGKETTHYEGYEAQQQINEGKKFTSYKWPVKRSVGITNST
jgi:hypothetical protein